MAVTEVIALPSTIRWADQSKPETLNPNRKSYSEPARTKLEQPFDSLSITNKQTAVSTHYSQQLNPRLDLQSQQPYLVNSPYLGVEHQLDLSDLDIQTQLLAQALTVLAPATPSFATTAYQDSLNWSGVLDRLRDLTKARCHHFIKQDFYVVEFRSKLKPDINRPLLFKLDKESHREATASGGLLKYWFGEPDSERQNLATCLWRFKSDAINGGKGPWHKKARGIIAQMYEKIEIRGLKLTIEDDVSGWNFEPWSQ